jgi:small GTP-binding protein
MNKNKHTFNFKITVIGDGTVGKTSLIKNFTQGSFQEDYMKTLGAQWSKHVEEINGDTCQLFFWDIAGQDTFHFLRPSFYNNSVATIIVYSLEDNDFGKESLKHVIDWHNDIKKFCGDIPIIVFGNKVDLVNEDEIDEEKILKIVKKRDFWGYYRTSAKTGQNVKTAFRAIIQKLYSHYKPLDSMQEL